MNSIPLIWIAAGYFALLLLISRFTSREQDNNAFFRGSRKSPWWAVAFGMIGASISGVTFVSVPGMVNAVQMSYLQTCMGFIVGYLLVAFILLPIYYRLNLISIYTYLQRRFGLYSYRTGASFFFFSKLLGASIRLYLVCMILQRFVFEPFHFSFMLTTCFVLVLIWFYTRNSGIRTIVWSDCLQTLVLLSALVLIIHQLCVQLNLSIPGMIAFVRESEMSTVFRWEDVSSKQYFWKQFLSGIFIVVVMTGLDQDMMQKNLTCKTLKQSQLNMCVNGLMYLPVNLLFLCLGILLYHYCHVHHLGLPGSGDELLPMLCSSGRLGEAAMIFFTLGIIAAAFSSADSAMTSLTTCFCVDILMKPGDERLRRWVHPCIAVGFFLFIMLVEALNSTSVIDAVYTVCGYTYGPLLGLFAFGLFTRLRPREKMVPVVCLLSPLLCYGTDLLVRKHLGYQLGYELLMLNGAITFLGLLATSSKFRTDNAGGNCHV